MERLNFRRKLRKNLPVFLPLSVLATAFVISIRSKSWQPALDETQQRLKSSWNQNSSPTPHPPMVSVGPFTAPNLSFDHPRGAPVQFNPPAGGMPIYATLSNLTSGMLSPLVNILSKQFNPLNVTKGHKGKTNLYDIFRALNISDENVQFHTAPPPSLHPHFHPSNRRPEKIPLKSSRLSSRAPQDPGSSRLANSAKSKLHKKASKPHSKPPRSKPSHRHREETTVTKPPRPQRAKTSPISPVPKAKEQVQIRKSIPADVYDSSGKVVVVMDLPGVTRDNLSVKCMRKTVTITVKRRTAAQPPPGIRRTTHHDEIPWGEYSRAFELPEDVDTEKLTAQLKNGELYLTMPKRKTASRPVSIPVS